MKTQKHWQIDHIGIAVADLNQAITLYSSTTSAEIILRETIQAQGVELVFLNTGATKIELLAPLRADTPLGRFIDKRGPGLHHICYRVENLVAELSQLAQKGFTLIDSAPRPGAGGSQIAFISPKSFNGVLTELCEYPNASS